MASSFLVDSGPYEEHLYFLHFPWSPLPARTHSCPLAGAWRALECFVWRLSILNFSGSWPYLFDYLEL